MKFATTIPMLLALAMLATPLVHARNYPSKPVRVIIGYPSGAGNDVIARLVLAELPASLGQQFVVDNRPGATGNIGAEMVARSTPDGYTLLNAPGSIAANFALSQKHSYDLLKDLVPVAVMASVPFALSVPAALPVKTGRELIDYARSRPGQLTFASSGTGGLPHLTGVLFSQQAGLNLLHVPYKGTGQALLDVVSGQVTMIFSPTPSVMPHFQSKRAKVLAITSTARLDSFPGVPTMDEATLPGFVSRNWIALFAPRGTPDEVFKRLNPEINRVVQTPAMREKFSRLGAEPLTGEYRQWAPYVRDEVAKWAAVIKAANIPRQ